ncbi:MAG: WD40 repeat domain-containing protein [Planctomycetota bacterium]|jgi:WD40 repeat protein
MASESITAKAEPKEIQTIEPTQQVCRVRFSPDGSTLFGGGYDAKIHRWDLSGEEAVELPVIKGHRGWVQSIEFGPNGGPLFSVDSWGQLAARSVDDANVELLWNNESAHDGWIHDFSISGDGSRIATVGRDRFTRVWSAEDGAQLFELPRHEHELYRVAIHPDGQSLVTGDLFGTLSHWDLSTGKVVRELKFEKLHYYDRIQDVPGIFVLRFDQDGETLLCGGGEPTRIQNHQGIPTLHQIDWASFEVLKTQQFGEAKDGFVFDLARHPDGYFLLATSGNPGAGQFLLTHPDGDEAFFKYTKLSNCHSVSLHPDGTRAVVSATNRRSQGNGAVRDEDGNYVGNTSPLHVFALKGSETA